MIPIIPAPAFAMFWAGESVSAYEAACMSSFVRHGYALNVYSYGGISNLPSGAALCSAHDIVDEKYVRAYLIKGKPSLSHFSDLFRYRLFQKTDFIYVDTDLYLLRPFDFVFPKTVLALEDKANICGAIMRIDRASPLLAQLVARTEKLAGRDLVWGETGPRLVTSAFGNDIAWKNAFRPDLFFPIHYNEFWKTFLPEHREECESLCRGAYTLHLWNNIVGKVGVWKEVLPPEGCYLERRFVEDGFGHLFQGTFPVDAMRHVIDNYRMRLSGSLDDVRRILQLALPALSRRATRRLGSLRHQLIVRVGGGGVGVDRDTSRKR